MRGFDQRRDGLFSYVRPESRIPSTHPLRVIHRFADDALAALNDQFAALYSENGLPAQSRLNNCSGRCRCKPSTLSVRSGG